MTATSSIVPHRFYLFLLFHLRSHLCHNIMTSHFFSFFQCFISCRRVPCACFSIHVYVPVVNDINCTHQVWCKFSALKNLHWHFTTKLSKVQFLCPFVVMCHAWTLHVSLLFSFV